MIRRLALLLLLPCLGHAGGAELIQESLKPFTTLRGHFEQTKAIQGLKRPLKSSGDFLIAKDKGLLWMPKKPLASVVKMTQNEVAQLKDGKQVFKISAQEQPGLRLIAKVMFSVFSADLPELERHFDVKAERSGDGWKAELSPKEAWVAKVAARIELKGGSFLESVSVDEANGDRTQVHFLDLKAESPLRPEEARLLE